MSVMETETGTKACGGRCKKVLPLSSFYAESSGRPDSYCKDCRREYQASYMAASRQARKEIAELREHVGELEETVAGLTRRISQLGYIGTLEQVIAELSRRAA
jgi:hypothetical protein